MKEKNSKIDSAIKLLKQHYNINIIFLAVLFIFAMFQLLPFFTEKQPASIVLERYIIVITIIVIPSVLKLFPILLKKIPAGADIGYVIGKYKKASYIRLYTLSALTIALIILYDYSGNMNFFWFTVVLFILFIYCKPSFPELERLINSVILDNVHEKEVNTNSKAEDNDSTTFDKKEDDEDDEGKI